MTTRISSGVGAGPKRHETVRQRGEELEHADDPFAYYVELMSESVRRNGRSELGLARLRVETDTPLDAVIEGDVFEVAAEVHVPSDTSAEESDEPTS